MSRTPRVFRRIAPIAAAAILASTLAISAQKPAAAPKLIVILVVDQMRADYLERYSAGLTGGLRRLMSDGAWFDHAAFPYLNTVTCPGHATIATGAFPYRHGMILNAWIDRQSRQSFDCTADPDTKEITYNSHTGPGESAKRMLVPTLADQIRERARGRVVALSLKTRSAVTLAGRKGDAVVWFSERGSWATSTAYADKRVPFIEQFIQDNPIAADLGKSWERSLDASKYQNDDDAPGESPPTGWTRSFPHELGKSGKPDAVFLAHWLRTPYADEYLGRMAAASIDALQLGRGSGTDFLGVSFSTLDSVGHAFGPNSHEVQDVIVRLDRTIGRLLDHLDTTVGRSNYVLALSSDHGVATIPEQTPGGGRQYGRPVLDAIDAALRPILGTGKYAWASAYTDIYLAPGVFDVIKENMLARKAIVDALRAVPGVEHVFLADELDQSSARTSKDPIKRAAALSYHSSRSGDVIIVPKENWLLTSSATTHGTHHPYDQQVPVIFYGAGVQGGRYATPATPADIAPTLSALARVNIARVDGRVLNDAIATAPSTK